ncbi:MAG: hypothetical protein IKC64_06135 [Clostridia bacterium]|nr:hypothetical protein [Clostridia bacterium]
MSVRSIDLEMLVSNAYHCSKNFSYDQYVEQTADLIYQGFFNFDFDGGPVLDKYREKYSDPAFTIVHNYVTLFVYDDGRLYRNEYDTYCKLCGKCGHKFYSPDELTDFRRKLTASDFRGLSSFIRLLREHINPSYFQNFIYGLVMLSLMDTGEFRESAYNLIASVLTIGVDNCPSYNVLMSRVYKW